MELEVTTGLVMSVPAGAAKLISDSDSAWIPFPVGEVAQWARIG